MWPNGMIVMIFLMALSMADGHAASELPDDWAADVTLLDAVTDDGDRRSELHLVLSRVAGHWLPVIALAPNWNSSYHHGHVVSAVMADDRVELELAIAVVPDAWVPGGRMRCRVVLTADEDGWQGQFDARLLATHRDVQGLAQAEVYPPNPQLRPPSDWTDHPRLLLRAEDLPALRAKLATPFGQAALARMTNAPGLALRHLLTGDRALADAALVAVQAMMAETSSGSKFVAHRVWAWRAEAIALAFDWCYHAWSPSDRAEVVAWLRRYAERAFYQHGSFTEYTGWRVTHKLGNQIVSGAALAALAIVGEPGPERPAPQGYLDGRDPSTAITAITGLPGQLPAHPLTPTTMPSHWWFIGGLLDQPEVVSEPLPLSDAGWQPLPAAARWEGRISLNDANNNTWLSVNHLACAVDIEHDQWLRFRGGFDNGVTAAQTWISGVPVRDGDVIRLAAGRHVVQLRLTIGSTNPWGKIACRPRFETVTDTLAHQQVGDLVASADDDAGYWQQGAEWRSRTGGDPHLWQLYAAGRGFVRVCHRHIFGDGGFPTGERVLPFMLQGLIRYAAVYRSSTGRALTPQADIEDYLSYQRIATIYHADGYHHQSIDGLSNWQFNEWFESRDVAAEQFAALYPVVPAPARADIARMWRQHLGVTDTSTEANVLRSQLGRTRNDQAWEYLDTHAVWAFITYPLLGDDAATESSEAAAHVAMGAGWFGHRNRFHNGDDVVVQVFANHPTTPSWELANAGAIRLHGLGRAWLAGTDGVRPMRAGESVLQHPGQAAGSARAPGHMAWPQRADHHVSVAIDMSATLAEQPATRARHYTGLGRVLTPSSAVTPGSYQRIVGIDTSGRSGADAILVIADRTNQPDADWRLVLDALDERYGTWAVANADGEAPGRRELKRIRRSVREHGSFPAAAEAAGFAVTYRRDRKVDAAYQPPADAIVTANGERFQVVSTRGSLTGLVLSAQPVVVQHLQEEHFSPVLVGHSKGVQRLGLDLLTAERTGSTLTVLTLQSGEPPAITVTGVGLDAVVQVGEVEVRLDGDQIQFD